MLPDDQETLFWEMEETNKAINQYFCENLPCLRWKRRAMPSAGNTEFIILNYISKAQRPGWQFNSNPYINFSVDKIYIRMEGDAWELNIGDPNTPKNIMSFLELHCQTIM